MELSNCKLKISNFQFSIPRRLRLLCITGALGLWICALSFSATVRADVFLLPTANHAIYEPGLEEKFCVPTPGKTWTSGTFGCVATDGWQIRDGLDIRCLQRT